ncbi:putative membrane protein At4g09580 [Wolffia australiana]
MGGQRNMQRDEEIGRSCSSDEDSPASKKLPRMDVRFPLTRWEFMAASSLFFLLSTGLFLVYLCMPAEEYGEVLRLPRSISDIRELKDNLADFAYNHQAQFMLGYCSIYIFMQTFMIPGTIFLSLLAGSIFGVLKGGLLVVLTATLGASSCYLLSKLIGKPIISWLWPEKLRLFQAEVGKRGEKLLNYMLFLRITPSLPNTFINLASPIVDIPFGVFFLATLIGLIPSSYITVKAGQALGELRSVRDLYDMKTLVVLFLIGSIAILPTILKRKRTYE